MNIRFREYVEPGAETIGRHNVRLDDAKYEEAMRAFPVLCADVLPIDRGRGRLYLATRSLEPKRGWWNIGGRVLRGEPIVTAALRKLREEAGLEVSADRLELVAMHRYVCTTREQHPREAGTDCPTFVFIFEPTVEELEIMHRSLDRNEYQNEKGMRAFAREDLLAVGADPALVQLYDDLFG